MHDKSVKNETIQRLKRAEGHLKKVIRMVEEGQYCPDVIHQSQAVQAALKAADEVILNGHLKTCVLKDLPGSKPKRDKLADEIVDLFKKNSK